MSRTQFTLLRFYWQKENCDFQTTKKTRTFTINNNITCEYVWNILINLIKTKRITKQCLTYSKQLKIPTKLIQSFFILKFLFLSPFFLCAPYKNCYLIPDRAMKIRFILPYNYVDEMCIKHKKYLKYKRKENNKQNSLWCLQRYYTKL